MQEFGWGCRLISCLDSLFDPANPVVKSIPKFNVSYLGLNLNDLIRWIFLIRNRLVSQLMLEFSEQTKVCLWDIWGASWMNEFARVILREKVWYRLWRIRVARVLSSCRTDLFTSLFCPRERISLPMVSNCHRCTTLHWTMCLLGELSRCETQDDSTERRTSICPDDRLIHMNRCIFVRRKPNWILQMLLIKPILIVRNNFASSIMLQNSQCWQWLETHIDAKLISDHLSDYQKSKVKFWEHNEFRTNAEEQYLVKYSLH
jgi:hypothetical protein